MTLFAGQMFISPLKSLNVTISFSLIQNSYITNVFQFAQHLSFRSPIVYAEHWNEIMLVAPPLLKSDV